MNAFLKTAGRWGGIVTIIALVIVLLKQLIALISFLMIAIKLALIIVFVGLMLLILFAMMRGRTRRRREAEDL